MKVSWTIGFPAPRAAGGDDERKCRLQFRDAPRSQSSESSVEISP